MICNETKKTAATYQSECRQLHINQNAVAGKWCLDKTAFITKNLSRDNVTEKRNELALTFILEMNM
jgi:hypothetical protein